MAASHGSPTERQKCQICDCYSNNERLLKSHYHEVHAQGKIIVVFATKFSQQKEDY